MSMRLGDLLIDKGLISEPQLKKGLEAQLIFGAHLGTCLIELGYLTEEKLGETLADAFKIRYASPDRFDAVPQDAIEALPRKFVEEHRVVPFDLKRNVLHVAMIDPRNVLVLDELAFVSGYKIEAWISPEVRIVQAMERYYEIARPLRYVSICKELEQKRVKGEAAVIGGKTPRARHRKKERPEAATEKLGGDRAAVEQLFSGLSDRLCLAESKEQVAELILDAAMHDLEHSLLFHVKTGTASIWDSRGVPLDEVTMANLKFSTASVPFFKLLLENSHYRGPVPDDARYWRFYKDLRIDTPAEILVLPIYINDRLVSLFHGGVGKGKAIHGPTESYRRLMRKLALGLGLVSMKAKLRFA